MRIYHTYALSFQVKPQSTSVAKKVSTCKFTFQLGAYDIIDKGIKKVEFRKDTPRNRQKIQNKAYFTAYRGPAFSNTKLPHMDVEINNIHFLDPDFRHSLLYPNLFQIHLKGPLIAIELGQVLRRGGPTTFDRWSPFIKNKIFY